MANPFSLPQSFKIVDATAGPVTTNGGVTSDVVSLKNAHKAWIVLQFTQAVGHGTVITPRQATDVAAGTNAVIPATPIWQNADTAASDTLVAATAAANLTLAADIKKKQVVFEIDPAAFTSGYDCLYFTVSDSSQATNFVSGQFFLLERYQQATPPAAITD